MDRGTPVSALGGIVLLVVVIAVLGRVLGQQAARSWDIVLPGTRPTRAQARERAVAGLRQAASGLRARPSGSRRLKVLGVVLSDPVTGGPPRTADATPREDPQAPPAPRPAHAASPPPPEPQAAPPASPAPQETNGRNTPVTTPAVSAGSSALLVPGAEEMTAGMARLRRWAVNGNAEQKEAAFRALAEIWEHDAATVRALAQDMAEHGKYGIRVTEAVSEMAPVLSALSMRAAEAESMIAGVLNSTGRDLIASGQAPERRELMAEPGGL